MTKQFGETFISTWQSSPDVRTVSLRLQLSRKAVRRVERLLRKNGLTLRYLPTLAHRFFSAN